MARIKAGDLRTEITLMRPDGGRGSTGLQRGVSFADVATVRAKVTAVSSRQFFEAHAAKAEDILTITIRWRDDVTDKWRARHHGIVYDILEVNPLGYMRDYMTLKCKAVAGGGV